MTDILILKTGALGDVLRTTAIVPGLAVRYPACRITWLTAHAARDLVEPHPGVHAVLAVDPKSSAELAAARAELLGTRWDRLLSLDDEEPLCRLASALDSVQLSGAYLDADGRRAYTDDVAEWFDMGLLSRHGKERADELKIANTRTHPAIYADMFGIEPDRPRLDVPPAALEGARAFAAGRGLGSRPLIGLNTGAGGRWKSKGLLEERVVRLARSVDGAVEGGVDFLLFGGPEERLRNRRLVDQLEGHVAVHDAGTDNGLLDFAARVGLADLLVTSDSLALHVGICMGVRIVAFFAPTSAAEVDLFGLGEKIRSTTADYASYRPDADNGTISVERLRAACLRQLNVLAVRPRE